MAQPWLPPHFGSAEASQHVTFHLADIFTDHPGTRCEADFGAEKIGSKIRNHQILKTLYMLVLSDQEVQARKVALRHRTGGDCGQFSLEDFVRLTHEEITTRSLQPAFQPVEKAK